MKEEFAWKMWAAEQMAKEMIGNLFFDYSDMHICESQKRYISDMLKMEVFRKVEPKKACGNCFFLFRSYREAPCDSCLVAPKPESQWRGAE